MEQGEPKKHCPDCNTGSCFYKILLDGTLRHFCACRRTYWDWDAPPSSEEILSILARIKELEEAVRWVRDIMVAEEPYRYWAEVSEELLRRAGMEEEE